MVLTLFSCYRYWDKCYYRVIFFKNPCACWATLLCKCLCILWKDQIIIVAHAFYGNKWTSIARLFIGRTHIHIINHWNPALKLPGVENNTPGNDSSEQYKRFLGYARPFGDIIPYKSIEWRDISSGEKSLVRLEKRFMTWMHLVCTWGLRPATPVSTSCKSKKPSACMILYLGRLMVLYYWNRYRNRCSKDRGLIAW